MTTTVTISNETHRMLKELKQDRGSDSFDKLIREVAEKELDIPDSLKGKGNLKVEKEAVRDRKDRTDRYLSDKE